MDSEKVKEIKKALELNEYFAIEYVSKSGEPKIFTFTDLLTLIDDLESENERLKKQNYKLEQNLGQCENGYKLELHTARHQLYSANEDLKKAESRIAELEDKIENGTLVELHCKVGDSFFAIVGKSIREYEIDYIKICKKNKVRLISTESFGFDLGKDAFLTKAEAEKLKELKDERRI